MMSGNGANNEAAAVLSNSLSSDSNGAKSKNTARKQKRPDMPLYIPPGSKNTRTTDTNGHHHKQDSKPDNKENKHSLPSDDGSPKDENKTPSNFVDSEFVNDLNNELGISITANQLTSSKLDYSIFAMQSPENVPSKLEFTEKTEDDGPHCDTNILEVYDFPPDFKTRDLITSLATTNFTIDWVDETHALLVFSSSALSSEAVGKDYFNLKLRPISMGSKQSIEKAQMRSKGQLSKPRPETTTLLARRLVAGALGIKTDINPEQRRAEREKLRLAKEKKQQVQKQVKNNV